LPPSLGPTSSLVKIGTCGFPLKRTQYFERFSAVEIQQTFYQPPPVATALKWREEAPFSFEFSLKAWQLITHEPSSPTYRRLKKPLSKAQMGRYGSFRPTEQVLEAWSITEEIARALRARVILFQTPASFRATEDNRARLHAFFRKIKRRDYLMVWEPRGGWPEQEIEDHCRELDLVHGVDPFRDRQLAGSICYFRLHGKGGFRYRYTDQDLAWLKDQIDPETIHYLMFNNVSMAEDAHRLQQLIHG
jgi:uncharacterized protein YecE (DUF72 family)